MTIEKYCVMKKIYMFAMGLAGIVLATSCSDEAKKENEPDVQQPIQLSFKGISADGDADTRTYLSGSAVWWNTDDAINVFSGSSSYRFDTKEGGATVTFVGVVLSEDTKYFALFPYDEDATYTSGTKTYTTTFPAEQTAVANSFAKDANVTVATTTNNEMTFHFKNVCGLIKFRITSAEATLPFTKAVLQGLTTPTPESIAGAMSIVHNSPSVPVGTITGSGTTITLNAPAETTFLKDTDYYIVVPPTTFTAGYKITFSNDGGTITRDHIIGTSQEVQRSKILDAGTFTYVAPTP